MQTFGVEEKHLPDSFEVGARSWERSKGTGETRSKRRAKRLTSRAVVSPCWEKQSLLCVLKEGRKGAWQSSQWPGRGRAGERTGSSRERGTRSVRSGSHAPRPSLPCHQGQDFTTPSVSIRQTEHLPKLTYACSTFSLPLSCTRRGRCKCLQASRHRTTAQTAHTWLTYIFTNVTPVMMTEDLVGDGWGALG